MIFFSDCLIIHIINHQREDVMDINNLIKENLNHDITFNQLCHELVCSISQSRKAVSITQNTITHYYNSDSGVITALVEAVLQYQYMVVSGLDVVAADIQDYLSQPRTNLQIDKCPQIAAIAELEGLDVDEIMPLGQYAQDIWVGAILDKGEIERYFLIKDTEFLTVHANSNEFAQLLIKLIDYLKIHIKEQVMHAFATFLEKKIQTSTVRIGNNPKANECYELFTICDVYIASKNTAIRVKPTIMVGGEFIELDKEVFGMMVCNDDLSIGFEVMLNNNLRSNLVRTY